MTVSFSVWPEITISQPTSGKPDRLAKPGSSAGDTTRRPVDRRSRIRSAIRTGPPCDAGSSPRAAPGAHAARFRHFKTKPFCSHADSIGQLARCCRSVGGFA